MSERQWSAVLFDLDGTLIDTAQGIVGGVLKVAEARNYRIPTREEQLSFIGPPVLESFQRVFLLGVEEARSSVVEYRSYYETRGIYEARVYDGLIDVLEYLQSRGIRLGVATLKRHDFALKILDHFGIAKYFGAICGIDEHDTKTKAQLIVECLHQLGVTDRQKAIFVGDSIYDQTGAELSGIPFLGVTYGYGFTVEVLDRAANRCSYVGNAHELGLFFGRADAWAERENKWRNP